jgi:sugar-phosphatase
VVKVFVIAGAAGSGKTTFGQALAKRLAIPLLDLDDVTAPLVESFRAAHPQHDEAGALRLLRDDRYRELGQAALTATSNRQSVIMTAPFTSEVSSPERWLGFTSLFGSLAAVQLIWLEVSRDERLRRLKARGASRDAHLTSVGSGAGGLPPVIPPAVGHLSIDAQLTDEEKIALVLSRFGGDSLRV